MRCDSPSGNRSGARPHSLSVPHAPKYCSHQVFEHGVDKWLSRKAGGGSSFERQQLELEFGPSEKREVPGCPLPQCSPLAPVLAPANCIWPSQAHLCNVAFLSLRPHVYRGWAEAKSYAAFEQLWMRGRLHCMPTLLPGTMKSATEASATCHVPGEL